MGFFQSLAKAMATKIGVVIGGDYKGVSVGFGTKSTKSSVSIGAVRQDEALIFFTKPEEYRFDNTDVESYTIKNSTNTSTTYEILFKDGKKSLVEINNQYKHKVDSAFRDLKLYPKYQYLTTYNVPLLNSKTNNFIIIIYFTKLFI